MKLNQISVLADVMNDFVYSTPKKPNEVYFSSAIEYVSSLTVQIVSTSDKSLPSNLKLEILGCQSPARQLSTKPQIEEGKNLFLISVFICVFISYS
jgi:hypothetical protein